MARDADVVAPRGPVERSRVPEGQDGSNAYALGREGYFSLNLVTGLADLPQHKPAAHKLLAALEYNTGKRYADFDEKTDHVAEYGLAALITGGAVAVAAKKAVAEQAKAEAAEARRQQSAAAEQLQVAQDAAVAAENGEIDNARETGGGGRRRRRRRVRLRGRVRGLVHPPGVAGGDARGAPEPAVADGGPAVGR